MTIQVMYGVLSRMNYFNLLGGDHFCSADIRLRKIISARVFFVRKHEGKKEGDTLQTTINIQAI